MFFLPHPGAPFLGFHSLSCWVWWGSVWRHLTNEACSAAGGVGGSLPKVTWYMMTWESTCSFWLCPEINLPRSVPLSPLRGRSPFTLTAPSASQPEKGECEGAGGPYGCTTLDIFRNTFRSLGDICANSQRMGSKTAAKTPPHSQSYSGKDWLLLPCNQAGPMLKRK